MTEKIFWKNPYQQSLTTTIAFSFSGGQESDQAFFNGMQVVSSTIKGDDIIYLLPENHCLTKGDEVTVKINWQRRYRLMRLHFAAELILELVTRMLQVEKIGAHIAEDKSRIDFHYQQNISNHFEQLLQEYNQIIENDYPIETGYLNVEKQRRYWKIHSFAEVPCGGTHVKSTAEVGLVKLKRKNIGKGKERIEIYLISPG